MNKGFNLLAFIIFFLLCSYSYSQKPKNLNECNAYLDKDLKAKDIKYIKNLSVEQLIRLHTTLGRNIRNELIYASRDPELVNYFHSIGIFHPDDISGIIIDNYWHYLNKKEFDLKSEVEHYQEYWKKNSERDKKNKENIAKTEKKLQNCFIDVNYVKNNSALLKLPQKKTSNGVFSDEFIKYKNGYIINSITTSPGHNDVDISYRYHFIDLNTNKLYKLNFYGFDTVYSVITIDSTLYVSGNKNHKLKIIKFENGKVFPVNLMVSDGELINNSWLKFGVYDNKLFALQVNGLYMYDNNFWQLKNRLNLVNYFKSRLLIPTENIKLTSEKLFFLQEVLQGRDCELFELDLITDSLTEFWKKHSVIDNYKKEINSYSIIDNDSLIISGQRMGNKILLSLKNDALRLYILDNQVKSDTIGDIKVKVRKVVKNKDKLLLIAENGIFELNNNEIIPLVFFENTEQLIPYGKHNIHFNFMPRSCEIVSENNYLIGGQYGGLYLVDLNNYSIKVLDDNEKINTIDFLKE